MKILFRILLAFLLALGVATAVVILLHVNRSGGNDDAQIGSYSSDGDEEVAEESDHAAFNDTQEDDRYLWQRAMEKPEGSEYWHYYPDIPADVAPGDKIVLSAIAHGFVDWQVDEEYANVELIDPSSDGSQVYVSFVMPDEKVVIRALYDDIFISNYQSAEAGDEVIIQAAANNLGLLDGMVGVNYNVPINISTDDFNPGLVWVWDIVNPVSMPDGLGLVSGSQIMITGTPTEAGTFNFAIRATDQSDSGNVIVTPVTIKIYDSIGILTEDLPDGIVGSLYSAMLDADTPPGDLSWWEWYVDGTLPAGLSLYYSGTQAEIRGVCATAGTINFTVKFASNTDFLIGQATQTYTITIHTPPVLTSTPPSLLDGMVDEPYGPSGYEVGINASNLPSVAGDWTWSIVNTSPLPSGLSIDSDTGLISGTPTAAVEKLKFLVRYTADPAHVSGYAEEEFTITILPRPYFVTEWDKLPKGMLWPPTGGDPEPEEPDYETEIYADGFPADTTWYWSVLNSEAVPPTHNVLPTGLSLSFTSNKEAIIEGVLPRTTVPAPLVNPNTGSFVFTVKIAIDPSDPNPNINKAYIERNFEIYVWERRYLNIEIQNEPSYPPGFVRREGLDVKAEPRRRAVMPGTFGVISTMLASQGFVRWEVLSDNVTIGNRHGTVIPEGQEAPDAYVRIEMPDQDVLIRGVHSDPPTVTATLLPGTVGQPYSGSFSATNVGAGSNPLYGVRWEVLSGDWPPGFDPVNPYSGVITGVPAPLSTDNDLKVFDFEIGLTLPGTMRIDSSHSITIHKKPPILYGDVNGDKLIDLSDLILLSIYLGPERPRPTINMEAADINRNGEIDNEDLRLLALFFARPGQSLGP